MTPEATGDAADFRPIHFSNEGAVLHGGVYMSESRSVTLSGGGGTVSMIVIVEDVSLQHAFAVAPWNFAAQISDGMANVFATLNEWGCNRLNWA